MGEMSFFKRGSFVLGDGQHVRFWEYPWLGNTSLADQFPSLYTTINIRNVWVANVLDNNTLNIRFRCVLRGERWEAWRVMHVQLNDEPDKFRWNLTASRIFFGKISLCWHYEWSYYVPKEIYLEIKSAFENSNFMWFLYRKVLLTKDNFAKIKWTGCKKCSVIMMRPLII
jgi:hypothetical protein